MKKEIDIKITYSSPTQNIEDDYQEVNVFLEEIQQEYEVQIDKKYGGLGDPSSLYEFSIHILANISLRDAFLQGILTNLAYDILKSGSKMSLKGFFSAYKKLRQRNEKYTSLDISTIKFEFQDVIVILYGVFKDSLPNMISEITQILITHYKTISEYDDRLLQEVHIPIIRDTELYESIPEQSRGKSEYRYPNIDEMKNFDKNDYFRYWGLKYKFQHKKCLYNLGTNEISLEEWVDPTENIY